MSSRIQYNRALNKSPVEGRSMWTRQHAQCKAQFLLPVCLYLCFYARQQIWRHYILCKFTLLRDDFKPVSYRALQSSRTWVVSETDYESLGSLKDSFSFFCCAYKFQRAATPAATCHMQWQAHTSMHVNVGEHTLAGEDKHVNMLNRKPTWA